MGKNLFLLILLFCIVIFIINFDLLKKNTLVGKNIESFVDKNFKVDNSKISEEKSVRFNKKSKYNASRIVYGFNDIDYFKKNKDNIFNFYGVKSDKLKSYFDTKYDDVKNKDSYSKMYGELTEKNILQAKNNNIDIGAGNENNEIGIGVDNENNVEKIYILVNNDIYSLKKDNTGNYTESIYKDNYNIIEDDVKKYLGENNYKIINKNIEELRLLENSSITETLMNMKKISSFLNTQIDLTGIQNMFDRDLKPQYKEKIQKVHELDCFVRYDNNVLTGYNFNINDKKLLVKDSKKFLEKLLTELGCNTENIDNWINENGDFMITYISFIKQKDNIHVTVYYNRLLN